MKKLASAQSMVLPWWISWVRCEKYLFKRMTTGRNGGWSNSWRTYGGMWRETPWETVKTDVLIMTHLPNPNIKALKKQCGRFRRLTFTEEATRSGRLPTDSYYRTINPGGGSWQRSRRRIHDAWLDCLWKSTGDRRCHSRKAIPSHDRSRRVWEAVLAGRLRYCGLIFGDLSRRPLNDIDQTIICYRYLYVINWWQLSPDVLYVEDKIYCKGAVDKLCPWQKLNKID